MTRLTLHRILKAMKQCDSEQQEYSHIIKKLKKPKRRKRNIFVLKKHHNELYENDSINCDFNSFENQEPIIKKPFKIIEHKSNDFEFYENMCKIGSPIQKNQQLKTINLFSFY